MFYLIFFLLFPSVCFAETVYYSSQTEKEIHDLSDLKTKEQIEKEFDVEIDQTLKLEPDHAVRIIDKKLTQYNYKQENEQIKQEKEAAKKLLKDKLKLKLKLTEEEWNDLEKALKD